MHSVLVLLTTTWLETHQVHSTFCFEFARSKQSVVVNSAITRDESNSSLIVQLSTQQQLGLSGQEFSFGENTVWKSSMCIATATNHGCNSHSNYSGSDTLRWREPHLRQDRSCSPDEGVTNGCNNLANQQQTEVIGTWAKQKRKSLIRGTYIVTNIVTNIVTKRYASTLHMLDLHMLSTQAMDAKEETKIITAHTTRAQVHNSDHKVGSESSRTFPKGSTVNGSQSEYSSNGGRAWEVHRTM